MAQITRENVVSLYRATLPAKHVAEFDACDADVQFTVACEEMDFDPDMPARRRNPKAEIKAIPQTDMSECIAAIEAAQFWVSSLKAGDEFHGTSGEARRRYGDTPLAQFFAIGADIDLRAVTLWDQWGRRVIGVGLIDGHCIISKVEIR